MRAADLGAARVAIWGLGREGRAAIEFLRARHPRLRLLLLDDSGDASAPTELSNIECACGSDAIGHALKHIDVLVKSPGVSLYRPEISLAQENGVEVTSLLNLWFAEGPNIRTVCVTGTKGKSTTASLIAHILRGLGRKAALAGNIGVPVTEIDPSAVEYAVIEVSSYQAADFDGRCDIAVLTSLFPEHLDWHRTLAAYYRDKLNVLRRSGAAIVNRDAVPAREFGQYWFNNESGFHVRGGEIFDRRTRIGFVRNRYLARPHNLSNVCAALTVAKVLGLDPATALAATSDFCALPHRQQEIGEIGGVLYVDDSISTAPESTIAALEVYGGHDITLIVGGYDRGIDYGKLAARLAGSTVRMVICLGVSGERICAAVRAAGGRPEAALARSMAEAVALARQATPAGGVVLLSPAAPSYGYYRDFAERGRDFAAEAGLAGRDGEPPR
ncbi:MAG: UDP-N-acetylmuramoyl-L-alanine--D-glutamate ligase [Stellaceae bacterium]